MKTCRMCCERKNYREFREDSRYKDGHHSWCRDCWRKWQREWRKKNPHVGLTNNRKRLYGITPERTKEILKEQNGLCAICQVSPATHIDMTTKQEM